MDLFDAARIALRRWYILIPLLIVTAIGSAGVYRSAQTVYTTTASVGIAPPSTTTVAPTLEGQPKVSRVNTLLDSGGTTLLANLLAIGLNDPGVAGQLREQGAGGSYSATVLTRTGSTQLPVVSLSASGSSAAAAQGTLTQLIAQSGVTLTGIQVDAGVPDDLQAATYQVQPPYQPTADVPGRTRATGAALVAGIGLALIATVLLDTALRRRRPARDSSDHDPEGGDPDEHDPDEHAPDERGHHPAGTTGLDEWETHRRVDGVVDRAGT